MIDLPKLFLSPLRAGVVLWAALITACPDRAAADGGDLPTVSVRVVQDAANSGDAPGIFRVERTGPADQALTVWYRAGGSATNGWDYERLGGSITFPPGESAVEIEVRPRPISGDGPPPVLALTLIPANAPFSIAVLPDTQTYAREEAGATLDMFRAQTQWIVDHRDSMNIRFVLHEGDITESNWSHEWDNARSCIGLLDGVVPYALAVGNHDGIWTPQNLTAQFNAAFPVSRYQDLPSFGGVFESNRLDNSYHYFTAGGLDWLVFSLEFGPRNEVLAWANQIAAEHPDRHVIVVTHAHVYFDNTLYGAWPGQWWLPTDYGRDNNGVDVWEKFLRHPAGMGFVFSGHILAAGTGRVVGVGDAGNRVYQMAANYQDDALGGAGYLRVVQFFPDEDRMQVSTYSPWLDDWKQDDRNDFTYTNLGVFASAGPGYQIDPESLSASIVVSNRVPYAEPPVLTRFDYQGVPPVFRIVFDQPLDPVAAGALENYSIESGAPLISAELQPDRRTVLLTAASDPERGRLCVLSITNATGFAIARPFFYSPRMLAGFPDDTLEGWSIVDETTNGGPSLWRARAGRVFELHGVGGPAGAADNRRGSYIFWNSGEAAAWSNYTFTVTLNNHGREGAGLLFRYRNASNYYKLELDSRQQFRKLFKTVDGVETTLASEPGAYVVGRDYALRVELTNTEIRVMIDGTVLFGGSVFDDSQPAGSVGLYNWRSQGLCFSNLTVTPLNRWPRIRFAAPLDGQVLIATNSVSVDLDVFDPEDRVASVDVFDDSGCFMTLVDSPFAFSRDLDVGDYRWIARVEDESGRVAWSSLLTFTVDPPPPLPVPPSPPGIVQGPADQSTAVGGSAVFSVLVSGEDPWFQWYLDDRPIPGATNECFVVENAASGDAGFYRVRVTNRWGALDSDGASLQVLPTPPPAWNPEDAPVLNLDRLRLFHPGGAVLSVSATNLDRFRIETSTNGIQWTPIGVYTNRTGRMDIPDPRAGSAPAGFYRAVSEE
ncbi:MAG: metallophosphoesterase [Verrucomicrobiota bacterium]